MSKQDTNTILFTLRSKQYAFLSNDFQCPIVIDDKVYHHVEGYYQAEKFSDVSTSIPERIRKIYSPAVAKKVSNDYVMSESNSKLWDKGLKLRIMRRGVLVKFLTSEYLSGLLVKTGNCNLVYNTTDDDFWGNGEDNTGKNMLGQILQEVRSILRGLVESSNS